MKQMVFGVFSWAGVVSVIVSIAAAASEERGTIEGDAELLQVLAAAQSTGRSWFPRGALTASVFSSHNAKVLSIEADVVWDGRATYWSYHETETRTDGEVAHTVGKMIETPGSLVCYWPALKLAQVIRDKKRGFRKELRLRPDQIWFRMEDYVDWLELFDIGGDGAPQKIPFAKLVVREDGDEIHVARTGPPSEGWAFRSVASLAVGGNVVSYEGTPGKSGDKIWQRGSYEWAPVGGDRWYLKGYSYQRSFVGNSKNPEQRYELKVTSFDAEPRIIANRFDIASLNIAPATLVQEISAAGTREYRMGQRTPTPQEILDRLAEELGKRGFAARRETDQ